MKSIWYGHSTTLLIISQSPWLRHDSGIEVCSQQQLLYILNNVPRIGPRLAVGNDLKIDLKTISTAFLFDFTCDVSQRYTWSDLLHVQNAKPNSWWTYLYIIRIRIAPCYMLYYVRHRLFHNTLIYLYTKVAVMYRSVSCELCRIMLLSSHDERVLCQHKCCWDHSWDCPREQSWKHSWFTSRTILGMPLRSALRPFPWTSMGLIPGNVLYICSRDQTLIPEIVPQSRLRQKPGYFWQGKKSSVILHRCPQSRESASTTLPNTMPSVPGPPLSVIMMLNLHTVDNLERFS